MRVLEAEFEGVKELALWPFSRTWGRWGGGDRCVSGGTASDLLSLPGLP